MRGEGRIFQEPKTRSGRRTIQLGEGRLQVLRVHYECQKFQKAVAGQRWHENDLIFPSSLGTPMDPSNLRLDFSRVIERAGVPKVRFHDLRHTTASIMLSHVIPPVIVVGMLGHSLAILMTIFAHFFIRRVCTMLSGIATPPGCSGV